MLNKEVILKFQALQMLHHVKILQNKYLKAQYLQLLMLKIGLNTKKEYLMNVRVLQTMEFC